MKKKPTDWKLEALKKQELLEKLNIQFQNLRKSKYKLRVNRRKSHDGEAYCRVSIPDTHGCFIEPLACAAMLDDLESIRPKEIIFLGDHLECGGFLAAHQTLGYVAESEYTFQDDTNAANQLLDAVQARCPDADISYLEGNHERRIERWIMTQKLMNHKDAEQLRSVFSANSVLSIEQRGIRYIRQGIFYENCAIPATIKLGKCYFTHGSYTGTHAAKKHVDRFGGNVNFGHTHQEDTYTTRTVKEPRIGGWSSGCLCRLQRLWNHTNPTSWVHGYGLQIVQKDGSFLHVNVPILDGRSYLDAKLLGG